MKKDDRHSKTISADDVRYAAGLSRLSLGDDDVVKFQAQLSQIIEYIAQLEEVDTETTLPTTHVLSSMKNVFREDEIKESLPTQEALKNAPSKKGDFFKVPKII